MAQYDHLPDVIVHGVCTYPEVIIRPENISPEELLDGYDKIKWHFYSNLSILKRSYPNIKIGFFEAVLYFTLNKGYQKRNNPSVFSQIYQNSPDNPVDFNVAKYVLGRI